MMAMVEAPVDVIDAGSYLPGYWPKTYATADTVAYDNKPSVKNDRAFLLNRRGRATS